MMVGCLVRLRWFSTFAAMLRGARVVLEHRLVTWLVVHRGFDRVKYFENKEKTFEKLNLIILVASGLQLPKKIQKETSRSPALLCPLRGVIIRIPRSTLLHIRQERNSLENQIVARNQHPNIAEKKEQDVKKKEKEGGRIKG